MMRSYHPENSRTHQNTELKPDWACLVLTWVTSGESQVTHCLLHIIRFDVTGALTCTLKKMRDEPHRMSNRHYLDCTVYE